LAYDRDPRRVVGFGAEAVTKLGLDPSRVFKTLVTTVDGEVIIAVVPVSGSLDLRALAQVTGGRRAAMAAVAEAERATGYVVGGISPVGQRRAHTTIIDSTAQEFETVFVSGGARGLDIEIAPEHLADITRAVFAPISRADWPN
jgi:Cys-tRNA(Pro)/Cys-tRNA(Cys) deacylase